MVKVESLIIEFNVMPRWSLVGEYHVWWWALKSPVMILLSMFSSRLKRVVIVLSSMSVAKILGGI